MRSFRLYLLTFTFLVLALNLYAVRRYDLAYPHSPGPTFDKFVRQNHTKAIAEIKPSYVLIGDSTLVKGVDSTRLAGLLQVPLYSIGLPGSASTLWYLIIKNNIMEAPEPPKYLVVFFRDSMLTMPGYRVQGQYFKQIDEYASPKDTLLVERAYAGLMNPAERFAETYLPLYAARYRVRDELDAKLRYVPAEILGCDAACVGDAFARAFDANQSDLQALNDAILEADQDLYSSASLDFDARLEYSFLPEMVRLANERGIQLILVRIKTAQDTRIFPALNRYMDDLKEYARDNNVIVLDFADDPRLPAELYADTLHLNAEGKLVFTDILAKMLKDILR